MPTILKTKTADKILRWAACVLMAACAAIFMISQLRYSTKLTFMDYAPYPVAAVVLCWLLRGEYKARPVYWLGAAFVVWYGVTRVLIRDVYGRQPFYYYAELGMIYLFAFAFARAMGEETRLRVLDWFARVTIAVVTAASVLGLYVVIRGQSLSFANERYCTVMLDGRLWTFGINPNICAVFIVMALLLTVYLMLRRQKWWGYAVGAVVLVVNYLALQATDSRTAKLSLLACVAVLAAVLIAKAFKRRSALRWAAIVGAAAAAVLICYFGFSLGAQALNGGAAAYARRESRLAAETVMSEETVTAEEATEAAAVEAVAERELVDSYGSGRVRIYQCFFSYLNDHPSVLLKGANNFTIRLMSCYELENPTAYMMIHLHNSFFQTLAATGVPGLLLVLAICVFLLIYSLRILFSRERTAAEKMLPIFLLVLIVDSVAESPLFVPYDEATNSFFNFFFFLCAGYVVELGQKSAAPRSSREQIGE